MTTKASTHPAGKTPSESASKHPEVAAQTSSTSKSVNEARPSEAEASSPTERDAPTPGTDATVAKKAARGRVPGVSGGKDAGNEAGKGASNVGNKSANKGASQDAGKGASQDAGKGASQDANTDADKGASQDPSQDAGKGAGKSANKAPSAATVVDVQSNQVVAVYRAEGGFAGVRDTLTVYADGRTELDLRPGSTVAGHATKAQLADLTRLVTSKEFASATTEYGHQQGLDRTTYAIVVGDKATTIAGAATLPGALPKPVAEAQAILDALMTDLRSR